MHPPAGRPHPVLGIRGARRKQLSRWAFRKLVLEADLWLPSHSIGSSLVPQWLSERELKQVWVLSLCMTCTLTQVLIQSFTKASNLSRVYQYKNIWGEDFWWLKWHVDTCWVREAKTNCLVMHHVRLEVTEPLGWQLAGQRGKALEWVSAPWQRVDTDLSLQEGQMEKLRIGASNCAVSLAKGKYFRNTIELVFLFKCVGFGDSFFGHIRRQLLGAVWLWKSRQPGLQHCRGVYFTGQKAAKFKQAPLGLPYSCLLCISLWRGGVLQGCGHC